MTAGLRWVRVREATGPSLRSCVCAAYPSRCPGSSLVTRLRLTTDRPATPRPLRDRLRVPRRAGSGHRRSCVVGSRRADRSAECPRRQGCSDAGARCRCAGCLHTHGAPRRRVGTLACRQPSCPHGPDSSRVKAPRFVQSPKQAARAAPRRGHLVERADAERAPQQIARARVERAVGLLAQQLDLVARHRVRHEGGALVGVGGEVLGHGAQLDAAAPRVRSPGTASARGSSRCPGPARRRSGSSRARPPRSARGCRRETGVCTASPAALAARTARRVCSSVIPLRSASRFFCTPLSAPKRIAQQPASRKASSSSRSTWCTQAEANQTMSSRSALMRRAISRARPRSAASVSSRNLISR